MSAGSPDAPDSRQQDDTLAAEFALCLLDQADAENARQRMAQDADFARQVRGWQERLAGLTDEITPVIAPARAKASIRHRLGHAIDSMTEMPEIKRGGRTSGDGGGGWFTWLLGAVIAGGLALGIILLFF